MITSMLPERGRDGIDSRISSSYSALAAGHENVHATEESLNFCDQSGYGLHRGTWPSRTWIATGNPSGHECSCDRLTERDAAARHQRELAIALEVYAAHLEIVGTCPV